MPGETQSDVLHRRAETLRRFNRFYTGRLGLLQKGHLDSPYSLTEARILYELAQRPVMTAREICDLLALDQGYVSRILARFEKLKLISRRSSKEDGRVQHIALTAAGTKAFSALDAKSHASVTAMLGEKTDGEQREIVAAAETFEKVLGAAPHSPAPVVIRPPKAGDLGWIVHRHGAVIAKEFGWDGVGFETKIAEILGGLGEHPGREQGWVAERDGDILGSVFVMPDDAETARLRVLYVEAAARGLGLGRKLVDLAVGFAREAGYRRMVLWTHSFQKPARKIYEAAGFHLAKEEAARSFSVEVVSETWELAL